MVNVTTFMLDKRTAGGPNILRHPDSLAASLGVGVGVMALDRSTTWWLDENTCSARAEAARSPFLRAGDPGPPGKWVLQVDHTFMLIVNEQ